MVDAETDRHRENFPLPFSGCFDFSRERKRESVPLSFICKSFYLRPFRGKVVAHQYEMTVQSLPGRVRTPLLSKPPVKEAPGTIEKGSVIVVCVVVFVDAVVAAAAAAR